MNTPLLREVQEYILDEPKRFNMETWCDRSGESPCGTTLCIAGAALTINAGVAKRPILRALTSESLRPLYTLWGCEGYSDVEPVAAKLLDLTATETQRLFYDFQWPQPFRNLMANAETPEAKAAIGVARIEHFIQTGE